MKFKTWDIVAVPFPYTEGTEGKPRPALIVSGKALHQINSLYWLLMITSMDNPAWPQDVIIKDIKHAGLPVPSVIRPAKIATLQEDKVLRRLGSLMKKERAAVKKALDLLLG